MTDDIRELLEEIRARGITLKFCSLHGVHSIRGRRVTKKLRAQIERRRWRLAFWFAVSEEAGCLR